MATLANHNDEIQNELKVETVADDEATKDEQDTGDQGEKKKRRRKKKKKQGMSLTFFKPGQTWASIAALG